MLIGNAGVGKSWFQWMYLLFCVRPDIFEDGQLLPDQNKRTKPPEIILQYTPTLFKVLFLPLGVAHGFHLQVTLLYDPEDDVGNIKIPALRNF